MLKWRLRVHRYNSLIGWVQVRQISSSLHSAQQRSKARLELVTLVNAKDMPWGCLLQRVSCGMQSSDDSADSTTVESSCIIIKLYKLAEKPTRAVGLGWGDSALHIRSKPHKVPPVYRTACHPTLYLITADVSALPLQNGTTCVNEWPQSTTTQHRRSGASCDCRKQLNVGPVRGQ